MRTDDPAMLAQIRQLEATAESLRRICGFEPLLPLPETTASRRHTHACPWPNCTITCRTEDDLSIHLDTLHAGKQPPRVVA